MSSREHHIGLHSDPTEGGVGLSLKEVFPTLPGSRRVCRYSFLYPQSTQRLCDNEFDCAACHFHKAKQDFRIDESHHDLSNCPYPLRLGDFHHRGHMWARVERGGQVRVGVDSLAEPFVGTCDSVALPAVGDVVEMGEQVVALGVENGSTVWLLSPLSGKVEGTNSRMAEGDPGGSGIWMFTLRPLDLAGELPSLLYGAEVGNWIRMESVWLSSALSGDEFAADGGVLQVRGCRELPWRKLNHSFFMSGRSPE